MEANFHDFTNRTLQCKGKRAKCLRVSPPVDSCPFGGGDGVGGGFYSVFGHPPASSSSQISTTTEEDEDMAHCLILLAQSDCPKQNASNNEAKVGNVSCQRFFETIAAAAAATTSGDKAGLYIYECKTCNRKFPSFQALGGHRASHSKPKSTPLDRRHHHHDQDNHKGIQEKTLEKSNKAKIHECSICGLEFFSGQALGGHMRRHRPQHINTITMKASMNNDKEKARHVSGLDLNLPASHEDEIEF